MGQFGEALRQERISRGVALETISGATKIVTRYLTALEDEKFDALPGGILSKGIVRGYARTVGLDESAWVERFLAASQQQAAAHSPGEWEDFATNVSRSRPQHHRAHSFLRWAGFLLLLVLLSSLGLFVWHFVNVRLVASTIGPQQPPSVTETAAEGRPAR
ncbi:MAG TPA: helix-turn-helix domain-containing protein [Acidobacteriaceae bacterium]|nr:helix-turn-helix domain-containing protein [Acidobacteriaceae bacterium]